MFSPQVSEKGSNFQMFLKQVLETKTVKDIKRKT
jgi:hypothetical protein